MPGECVIFTATPTNGGAAPTFQWQVNGVNGTAPSTNATYEDCNLQQGDQVTVIVTSNLSCVSNSPATSTAQTITNVATVPFSVTLGTNPSPFIICSGETVSLFASTTNGGSTPTFAWTANDILLPGFNNDTLVYSGAPIPITDGTEICVIGTSSIPGCVTNSPDTICAIVTVVSSVAPTVSIAADSALQYVLVAQLLLPLPLLMVGPILPINGLLEPLQCQRHKEQAVHLPPVHWHQEM